MIKQIKIDAKEPEFLRITGSLSGKPKVVDRRPPSYARLISGKKVQFVASSGEPLSINSLRFHKNLKFLGFGYIQNQDFSNNKPEMKGFWTTYKGKDGK